MSRLNYYDVLGIEKNSSLNEIKNAYRKLALKFHPDKNKSIDAEKRFIEINEANEVLSNLVKRKCYDSEYFKNNPYQESSDVHDTYEDEYDTYYEESIEDDDYDGILQVDEIRKEVYRHLDELLEIMTWYCEKFSKLKNIKDVYEFVLHVPRYCFFVMSATSDHIGNLKDHSHHSSDFYDSINNRQNIRDELNKYLKHQKGLNLDLLGRVGTRGIRWYPSYARWIQIKTNTSVDSYDLIFYAKKFRTDMINIVKKSVLYQNKNYDERISGKSNGDLFAFYRDYVDSTIRVAIQDSGGIWVPFEQIPEDAHVNVKPWAEKITPNMEADFYQKSSLELLLYVNSLSREIYHRCVAIENQLNEFVNKHG